MTAEKRMPTTGDMREKWMREAEESMRRQEEERRKADEERRATRTETDGVREWTTGKCAGCGKEVTICDYVQSFPKSGTRRAVDIFVGTEEEHVCGSDNGPLVACKRKAREALSRCPGCNVDGTEPGEICERCSRMLEAGRRATTEEPLRGFCIRAWDLRGEAFREAGRDRDDEQASSELCRIIAKAVAGRGSEFRAGDLDRGSESTATVTDSQHEALVQLETMLKTALDAARRSGHKQGRSLLMALSDGKITPQAFDDAAAKVDSEDEP